MSIPTSEETSLIAEFRNKLKDVLISDESKKDEYLIRWIRARDHKLDKAAQLLRDHLQWREANNVDHVLKLVKDPFLTTAFPYWMLGVSLQGNHLVLELPVGKWDVRQALSRPQGESAFILYTTQMFETALLRLQELNVDKISRGGWPSTQIIAIMNWEGWTYGQLMHFKAMQNLLNLCSKYEAHYPEILGKLYFINCPPFFSYMFVLMKPLLAPRTLAKISNFSQHQTKELWPQILREEVGVDQVSTAFGGDVADRTVSNQ